MRWEFNSAYTAHIIADKSDGPRGYLTLSELLKQDLPTSCRFATRITGSRTQPVTDRLPKCDRGSRGIATARGYLRPFPADHGH